MFYYWFLDKEGKKFGEYHASTTEAINYAKKYGYTYLGVSSHVTPYDASARP